MNRHYTIEEYKTTVELLRQYYDHPAITTDVIVGFPGETDEDFDDTLNNLKDINLYEMHIFKYSRRPGTGAAKRKDQIPEEIKQELTRCAEMVSVLDDRMLSLNEAIRQLSEEETVS